MYDISAASPWRFTLEVHLDEIYWNFLDEMYYGPFKSIEDRIPLLDEQEREELAGIFQVKMEQAREGMLDEHYSTDALVDL
jgi:hypothetical protein